MIKRKYFIYIIPVALAVIFIWHMNSGSPWRSISYSLTDGNEEYLVFQEYLEKGQKIVCRLDLKDGADNMGKLILEMPNRDKLEWENGYQKTRKQLNLTVEERGMYRLVLKTYPYNSTGGKSRPEVEVDWYFKNK